MKILFDKSGELIVWSEGDSILLSISGNKYEVNGTDLDFFVDFIIENKKRIDIERERKIPLKEKLKKIWRNSG